MMVWRESGLEEQSWHGAGSDWRNQSPTRSVQGDLVNLCLIVAGVILQGAPV